MILNIKVCVGFCRTIIKLYGKFLLCRISSLVRGLLPIPGSSIIVRNIGSDLLSRRDISIKFLSYNILEMFCLNSKLFLVSSKLLRSYSRLMVAPDELEMMWLTHRVFSDRLHRLLVTLRPDRSYFVILFSAG